MLIQNLRAIVTGAGSGIGLATVRMLLQAGAAHVGMLGRSQEKLAAAAGTLGPDVDPENVVTMPADVRDAEALEAAFKEFVQRAGGLDVLVNAAAVMHRGPLFAVSMKGLTRYPREQLQETIDTNQIGLFFCCQLAVEQMVRKRIRGLIVNLSSISRSGHAGQVAYSGTKGAVASMTFSLARELAPYGIRSAAIAPGLVDTPMAEQIPEAYRAEMLKTVPCGRMGRPEEIAHGVRFCIENDFFNGKVLELDGGAFG